MPAVLPLLAVLTPTAAAEWTCSRSSQRNINQAVAALEANQPDEAEAIYRQILAREADCGLAGHGLGIALMRQNRPGEAAALMTTLATDYPEQPEALTGLSVAAFAAQDFSTARTAALQAVSLDVSSLEANAALLAVLLRQGEISLATQVVEEARGKLAGPTLACLEAQVLLEGGYPDQAQALLSYCKQSPELALVAAISGQLAPATTAAMADRVGAEAVSGISEALDALSSNDPATARAILDGVLTTSPERIDARILRARCHRLLGSPDSARADLEAAFDGETWIDVHTSGAMSGILLKSHEEQLEDLLSDGMSLLIQIQLEAGELEAARQTLTAAQGTLGAGPHLAAAEVRLLRHAGEAEEGWRRLQTALTTWPAHPTLLSLAGEWGLAEPAAMPAPTAAALAASSRWGDRYNLAAIQYQAQRPADCTETIRQAMLSGGPSTDSASRQQLSGLGYRCASQAGDLASTEHFADRLDTLEAQDPVARANHGLMRYSAGQGLKALEPLEDLEGPDRVMSLSATISLRVYAEASQYDRAIAVSSAAPAAERYWLGQKVLQDHNDIEQGLLLVCGACAELEVEARAQCWALFNQLSGPTYSSSLQQCAEAAGAAAPIRR